MSVLLRRSEGESCGSWRRRAARGGLKFHLGLKSRACGRRAEARARVNPSPSSPFSSLSLSTRDQEDEP